MFNRSTRKFGNNKVVVDGEVFDSKLEYNRYLFLSDAQRRGIISSLERQKRFTLIPTQRIIVKNYGKRGQPLKPKPKVVERSVEYVADFVYKVGDATVIEDTKGFATKEYIIKRKLMRYLGHPVTQVHKATKPISTDIDIIIQQ